VPAQIPIDRVANLRHESCSMYSRDPTPTVPP
jgi:hypothetical protein